MSNRVELKDELMDEVVGGNLTYTWFGGEGACGLNGNHYFHFSDKKSFVDFMKDCMINQGMSDVDTLKAMLNAGIIWT